ncbi:MAG: hypothetical protein RXP28_02290 [Nitrososphaeria archaeon]
MNEEQEDFSQKLMDALRNLNIANEIIQTRPNSIPEDIIQVTFFGRPYIFFSSAERVLEVHEQFGGIILHIENIEYELATMTLNGFGTFKAAFSFDRRDNENSLDLFIFPQKKADITELNTKEFHSKIEIDNEHIENIKKVEEQIRKLGIILKRNRLKFYVSWKNFPQSIEINIKNDSLITTVSKYSLIRKSNLDYRIRAGAEKVLFLEGIEKCGNLYIAKLYLVGFGTIRGFLTFDNSEIRIFIAPEWIIEEE